MNTTLVAVMAPTCRPVRTAGKVNAAAASAEGALAPEALVATRENT